MTKKREYLIEKEDGTRMKIKVPEEWGVTFGLAAVVESSLTLMVLSLLIRGRNSHEGSILKIPMALRFHESETRQRAIFTDVVAFRDTSIPIEVEEVKIQEKDGYQVKVKDWKNPDEPVNEHLLENIREEIDYE